MRIKQLVFSVVLAAPLALAQKWEIGGVGGGSFFPEKTVTAGNASGKTGFNTGFAGGAVIGQNGSGLIGGEIRYLYQSQELKLTSGSTSVAMSGRAHSIHYDLLIHGAPREARVRPYAAFGAGVKLFEGTGEPSAYQPLNNLAVLTATRETKPLLSVGGGIKFQLAADLLFRVEFRDYITPFPKKIIAPGGANAEISGWLHNFLPLFGLSFTF